VLDILGLDATAERVYQELVTFGPESGAGLSARVGLPDEAVDGAVAQLAQFGLITGRPSEQYTAAPPAAALGALVAKHRYALHQAELTVATLAEAYKGTHADLGAHDLVEIISGAPTIRQRFEQIQLNATAEFLAMSEARHEVVAAGLGDAEEEAIRRGVRYRVVVEHATLKVPDAAEALVAHLRKRQLYRVVEAVPTMLVIADRASALIPLTDGLAADGGEPVAMFVRAPGLIRLLLGLFESVWERAVPVRLAGTGDVELATSGTEPTGLDLRILSLLMVGATDAAIANQFGLGLRTVQRRVAGMMELAGVSTRLQLGWHACSRGWLNEPDTGGPS
jgi:sugar-specific transcriptional regulator TrmB